MQAVEAHAALLNRRRLILGLASALAVRGSTAWAQSRPRHRIAFLSGASKSDTVEAIESLRDGLRELGYREGDNLEIDARWADYSAERATELAGEIAARRPALIVTQVNHKKAFGTGKNRTDSSADIDPREFCT